MLSSNCQETREGLDVYPETTTTVCSEVRRTHGGSVTGIVTRLLVDCCAPHSQDSDSSLRSVFSSRRAFIRHTNRVSFAIIVTHRIARAGRTVSLSIGRRWIAMTLDPFRKRRMAQIFL